MEQQPEPSSRGEHLDVLIVGAGLSGIAAAYHLMARLPHKSFAILEGRERLGGTWDLFRYPGIRSDSDMYTLGFSFRPWPHARPIGDGASILAYLEDTAAAYGIDRKIRYRKWVERARWSSAEQRWAVEVKDGESGALETLTTSFLFCCVGYYDYDHGYTPEFAGQESFRGPVVHPQAWTDDIDVEGKRIVVIGSGATAVTLVPELAKKAAHVTMLQRSPTYVMALPSHDASSDWLRDRLGERSAHRLNRAKSILISSAFYAFCRRHPKLARRLLLKQVERRMGGPAEVARHFTPSYSPWEQRLCLAPDGDLFDAIVSDRASVVTDHIERFTEKGILLRSGRELEADLIVTATGLVLKFLGGITVEVDGRRIETSETMVYRGMMASDVPNLALATGYTNASWTLKCELTAEYVCRLLEHMQAHGYTSCRPRREPDVAEQPLIDFSSGYVQRAADHLPKQGNRTPWKLHQNYALDLLNLRHSKLEDGVLAFERGLERGGA